MKYKYIDPLSFHFRETLVRCSGGESSNTTCTLVFGMGIVMKLYQQTAEVLLASHILVTFRSSLTLQVLMKNKELYKGKVDGKEFNKDWYSKLVQ